MPFFLTRSVRFGDKAPAKGARGESARAAAKQRGAGRESARTFKASRCFASAGDTARAFMPRLPQMPRVTRRQFDDKLTTNATFVFNIIGIPFPGTSYDSTKGLWERLDRGCRRQG